MMVNNIIIIGDVRAPITKEFVEAQLHQLSMRSRFNATEYTIRIGWTGSIPLLAANTSISIESPNDEGSIRSPARGSCGVQMNPRWLLICR